MLESLRSNIEKITRALLTRTERPENLQKARQEFLPAALEVEESPANPAGRAINKAIMLLFACAIIWACVGRIDIVATAQGKIVPGERVKTIQPMSIGEVQGIHVREGDEVKAGDPLISLVGTVTEAELIRLEKEQTALGKQLARQEAFVAYLDKPAQEQSPVPQLSDFLPRADQETLTFEQQLLEQQVRDYLSASDTLDSQIKSKRAEQPDKEQTG